MKASLILIVRLSLLSTTLVPVSLTAPVAESTLASQCSKDTSKVYPFYASAYIEDLRAGPEHGVHDHDNDFYFSDWGYLFHFFKAAGHRTISTFICARKSHGGRLIGIHAGYRSAYKPLYWPEVYAPYHGWQTWYGGGQKDEYMRLNTLIGESITNVTYRTCGKHFEGIRVETSKGQWIECGDWIYTRPAQDKSCIDDNGGSLVPDKGRTVIGIYGVAKSRRVATEQGLRGLGFWTVPSTER